MTSSPVVNPYNITAHKAIRVPNEKVVSYYIHNKERITHFYLSIQFQNEESFKRFNKEMVPRLKETLKKSQYFFYSKKIFSDRNNNSFKIPLPVTCGNRYWAAAPQQTATFLDELKNICQYDFKHNLDRRQLEQHTPEPNIGAILASGSLTVLGSIMFLISNIYNFYVIAISGAISMFMLNQRDKLKTYCNNEYLDKNEKALTELTDAHKHSFYLGTQAADSYLVQFKSCFTPSSIFHPIAYYAGMIAKEIDSPLEKELMTKLRSR